eukprot:GHVT01067334.1.p1 GENE.GHVT01067334.1~~GHVT01067334.1.p1  ORF type:complete len:925 (+),score=267.41 GHVT01067334.1:170-2944(+)
MSMKLKDFIRHIRSSRTAAEERAVVAKECALIRTAFKENDTSYRHRNVAKLLFIGMLGYPTHFGQLECLKLVASNRFSDKRVGYLGVTCLLDENTEVLMLITNSIKSDLVHPNQYVNGLALAALGNIANAEMCRALAREVEELLQTSNPFLRKKAAFCAARMLRRVDEMEDRFNSSIIPLLEDRNHGVVLAGASLLGTLVELHPSCLTAYKRFVPCLVSGLRSGLSSAFGGAGAEYEVGGIVDPFLQVRILRTIRDLAAIPPGIATSASAASASSSSPAPLVCEELGELLAQVATNTDGSRNVGNSILYETAQTIMAVVAEPGVRVLAMNILAKFLQHKDNNIRYIALQTLQNVVKRDPSTVQRHRSVLVECLRDSDMCLRKKALDVTFALMNEDNIKAMAKELLSFLVVAESSLKADVATKLWAAVDSLAPTNEWRADTLLKVMCLAGDFLQEEVRNSFVSLIMNIPELQQPLTLKLFYALQDNHGLATLKKMERTKTPKASPQPNALLTQTAVWCLGEFADLIVDKSKTPTQEQTQDASGCSKVDPDLILDVLESVSRHSSCAHGSSMLMNSSASSYSSSAGGSTSPTAFSACASSSSLAPRARSQEETMELVVMCLLKLSTRLPAASRVRIMSMLEQFKSAATVELQQRSCEFLALLQPYWEASRPGVLDRMPAKEKKTANLLTQTAMQTPGPDASQPAIAPKNQPQKPKATPDLLDLDDLFGGAETANAHQGADFIQTPDIQTTNKAGGCKEDALADLLGGLTLAPSAISSSSSSSSSLAGGRPMGAALPPATAPSAWRTSLVAFEEPGGLKIEFEIRKENANTSTAHVDAVYTNRSVNDMTNFLFETAVPKYITLAMRPADGSLLKSHGANSIRQTFSFTNTQLGAKPALLKCRINYATGHHQTPTQKLFDLQKLPKEL